MLYPFQWQHIFIPLFPSKLVSYTAAPMPYIIGVRRSQLAIVKKEAIEDVIIIDLNSGDIQEVGGAKIVDVIGDSGSALKQTADQLQRAKDKASSVASSVWSWASSTTPTKQSAVDSGMQTQKRNKDLLMEIISDLRNVLATKPGSLNSLTAVAGSILGGSSETNKSKWAAEGERNVRESLLLFMTYLFYDM
jgi:BRCT domain type II-containing protein